MSRKLGDYDYGISLAKSAGMIQLKALNQQKGTKHVGGAGTLLKEITV